MSESPYNDPFYFALPRGANNGSLIAAEKHIAQTFGVRGRVEVVRSELAFTLCRVTSTTTPAAEREGVSAK